MDSAKTDNGGWRAEVQTAGDSSWNGNALIFRTPEGARAYVQDLMARWTAVTDTRVVAVDAEPPQPGENSTVDWAEEAGAARPHDDAPAWRVSLSTRLPDKAGDLSVDEETGMVYYIGEDDDDDNTNKEGEMQDQKKPTVWYGSGDLYWGQDGAVFDDWTVAQKDALELAAEWVSNGSAITADEEARKMLGVLLEVDWNDAYDIEWALSINKRAGGLSQETVKLLEVAGATQNKED